MSLTTPTVREAINLANANNLPSYTQQVGLGDALRAEKTALFMSAPVGTGVDLYNLPTLSTFRLPDKAKALTILRAYARNGTVVGEYTPAAANATPTTGQIAVTPSGDIAVLGADAPTNMDVHYLPVRGDVLEVILPVVAGVLTIPAPVAAAGVMFLLEAESLAGASVAKKIILAPAAALPAAGRACLSTDRTTVLFNNATDAVTSARVKLLVTPAIDMNVILEQNAAF